MSDPSDEELFQQARHLYDARRYGEAKLAFNRQVQRGYKLSSSLYYLGIIAMSTGNEKLAKEYLSKSVGEDPDSADAQFWLAELNLKAGETEDARKRYLKVRALRPTHKAAKRRLAEVEKKGRPSAPYLGDVYDMLRESDERFAQEAVRLIDRNRIIKSPIRLSAYRGPRLVWKFIIGILLALSILVGLGGLIQRNNAMINYRADVGGARPGDEKRPRSIVEQRMNNSRTQYTRAVQSADQVLSYAIAFFIVTCALFGLYRFYYLAKLKSIFVTIDRGIITVESGFFLRNYDTYEIYRIAEFKIHQGVLNRETGDGSLVLVFTAGERRKEIKGLAGYEELKRLSLELRSLHLALRSTSVAHGIMT